MAAYLLAQANFRPQISLCCSFLACCYLDGGIFINCPLNADCHIECIGDHSCAYSIINGTNNHKLSILCDRVQLFHFQC